METFLTDNVNEIFTLVKYFLLGIFAILLLNIFRSIIALVSEKTLREFEILHNKKAEDIEKKLKSIEDKVGLIVKVNKLKEEYDIQELLEQIKRDREKILEKEEKPVFEDTSFEFVSYEEHLKREKERLEKVLCDDTFPFEDFYSIYVLKRKEFPIREGYYHITQLCGVEMKHLDYHKSYVICKGVRKTDETIKLTKKDLKTDEIILEHEFDIYETSDKHIYKKFIVYHSLSDDNKRIRFFEKQQEGYCNVEIDDSGNPYVLTIHQNRYGNISVIRNYKNYEKYAEKIEVQDLYLYENEFNQI